MRNYIFIVISLTLIGGCCKEKKTCKGNAFSISPFTQKYDRFSCGSNDYEYTYIFNNSKQIDSLKPTCSFSTGIAFPVDETNMKYFLIGKTAYHFRDTFKTILLKDTCLKTFIYQVDLVQQDTTLSTFPGTISIYTAVSNIPSEYKVSINYKYVPLK